MIEVGTGGDPRFDPELLPSEHQGDRRLDVGKIDGHGPPHAPENRLFPGVLRQVSGQQVREDPGKGDLSGPVFDESFFHAVPHTTDAPGMIP